MTFTDGSHAYLTVKVSSQLGKTDGIKGLQSGNQRLAFRSRMQISLIECNLVSYR